MDTLPDQVITLTRRVHALEMKLANAEGRNMQNNGNTQRLLCRAIGALMLIAAFYAGMLYGSHEAFVSMKPVMRDGLGAGGFSLEPSDKR